MNTRPNRKSSPSIVSLLVGLFLIFLVYAPSWADSSIKVQNNTTYHLLIKTTSNLGKEYWKEKSTYIPAGSRGEIYETNRDKGVKDGKTYFFTSEIIVKDPKTGAEMTQFPQRFALRLQLKGSTVGSHMWQSVRDQVDRQHNWHDDRKKWNANMRIGDRQWNVKYWAYFTGSDDNVEYVFQEEYPLPMGNLQKLPADWHRSHLNILTYNIYMRPTSLFKNGQMIRAEKIPDKVHGYDVIVFQEAFDDGVRSELLSRLKKEYPHQSRILGSDRGLEQDGGVIMVSKWPIVTQKQQLFGDVCSGDDCLGDKGVLYVKINKPVKAGESNYFHIFGTHLNNGDWNVQSKQLHIIHDFIVAQKIPQAEPVLIAGDMNIPMADTNRYSGLLNILKAGYFSSEQLKGYHATSDGSLNDLGGGGQSYLDYVLYSRSHAQPTTASFAEVRILRSYDEWKEFPHEPAMWDLSDHFPVYANYHFHYDPLADWDPGLITAELTRYWKGAWNDVAAVATKQELDAVKSNGYQRVGAHGLLFKTKQAAEQWAKSVPQGSDVELKRQIQKEMPASVIQSRGLPEEDEGGRVSSGESETQEMETLEGGNELSETEGDGAEEGLEEAGLIQERGIRPQITLKKPIRPIQKSQAKRITLKLPAVLPLKLYFSDTYKDYLSTTSPQRGQQALSGAGKYREVGIQGYVFNQYMVDRMPLSLKSRTIPIYSYYHGQTRDNLIASSPGDIKSAETGGYKRVALEGYLIKPGPPPQKSCKVKSDCPNGFYCDTSRGICAPDIR